MLEIEQIHNVHIPRCYKTTLFGDIRSCQLHAFSDASEKGFGKVFYLRQVDNSGHIKCEFAIGNSRVAPLKAVTIPRKELTAATMGVRLATMIVREIGMTINKTYFWTDSLAVIRYIRNDRQRFRAFVANRINIIRAGSHPDQRRHIGTKENPVDIASRGVDRASQLVNSEL